MCVLPVQNAHQSLVAGGGRSIFGMPCMSKGHVGSLIKFGLFSYPFVCLPFSFVFFFLVISLHVFCPQQHSLAAPSIMSHFLGVLPLFGDGLVK